MAKSDMKWLDTLNQRHQEWAAQLDASYPKCGGAALTLLMYAFHFNKTHSLRLKPEQISHLIAQADLKKTDLFGESALHLAIYHNKAQQLKLSGEQFDLLIRGSDLRQNDRDGRSALLAVFVKYCFGPDHADLLPTTEQMDYLIAQSDLSAVQSRSRGDRSYTFSTNTTALSMYLFDAADRRFPLTSAQLGALIEGSDLNQPGPWQGTPLTYALHGNGGQAHELTQAQWEALIDGTEPERAAQYWPIANSKQSLLEWVQQNNSASFYAMFEKLYLAREKRLTDKTRHKSAATTSQSRQTASEIPAEPKPIQHAFMFCGIAPGTANIERVYLLTLEWIARFGLEPEVMYFSRIGSKWWQNTFARGHAKLQKEGFENITTLSISGNTPHAVFPWGSDYLTMTFNYNDREEMSRIELTLASRYRDPQVQAILQAMRELIEQLRPEAGVGKRIVTESDVHHRHFEAEVNIRSWAEYKLWQEGAHGGICDFNFLCEAQLKRKIDGKPLQQWIASGKQRGSLSTFAGGLSLWEVADTEREQVAAAIDAAEALVDREAWMPKLSRLWHERDDRYNAKHAVDAPEAPTSAKLQKRNALIDKIVAVQEATPDNANMPVVALDDFFDGNYDEASLAPNAYDNGRPSLKKCHNLLKKVRNRDDVQDVLVLIHETPDPEEEDDDDIWPDSDTIFIIASCGLEEIVKLTKALGSDEINEMGERWFSNTNEQPLGVPELQPGMKVFALWWD